MKPPPSPAPTGSVGSAAAAALAALEAKHGRFVRHLRLGATLAAIAAFYAVCFSLAHVDPARLVTGLPKLAGWLVQAWPPRVDELPLIIQRTAETVAMAAVGTTAAALLALPAALFASRNLTPLPALYYPVRWFLNMLRGIDSFVFALLFVAAVGLGPFAGVLGIAFHTWGSAAKLFADHLENADLAAYDAVRTTGAGRFTSIAYAVLPDVLPVFASTALFWLEFNIRASTVLGVVGAGGIGQELKNSMDLLDFNRLFTIIAVILVVVTTLDQISGWLRRKLV
ncbi:phosphonate ABC transporter, permease protein PhnE [Paraburkholderia hospita]|uniref:ABC transporter, phosphonate transport permease PhnE n=1 Tax=Paraburkholderia hospita TaxID=169430 RepID=A0AAJ4VNK4_9BURK|nr:phosphonate ABC transporter, permease protein PhnE [Paraburkholderia hospita]EUC11839.1 phosphonate ABC transporter, inner membrane subunit [Burkholderia sp. BT03]AUT74823.1 phosphonate ABC transporter, permease protein PhnE [Paraburkholderia hospita]AXF04452.1 phosphonate ABC transporter, permease protein PhnE [Paraburkholderia hospita]EIM95043.1 ABC transporter, phosphonate transport permease PhnE [Paraburkholderia hospita]OUL80023.1 phosphonate ABC transporter, permease protein PhnE [Par